MTLVERQLSFQLVLGATTANTQIGATGTSTSQQSFAPGKNTLTLSNLRATCKMDFAGGAELTRMQASIFGMTPSEMNAASTFAQYPLVITDSQVFVYAGDAVTGMPLAFQGTIVRAVADYNAMPDVRFDIEARSGSTAQMIVLPPTSVKGSASAADLLRAIAGAAKLNFVNHGVTAVLSNHHAEGSALDQVRDIAGAAQINQIIKGNSLIIWPGGTAQPSPGTITISPTAGLKGYPRFGTNDLSIDIEYNPAVDYGTVVNLQSSVQAACGQWGVYGMAHDLAAQYPGGPWFSTLKLCPPANIKPSS